jgi:PLP dependent protein
MLYEVIADICKKCGRDPGGVRLVAVTKTHPEETIMEAYGEGLRHFGENKVQELVPKMAALPDDIEWHMVGTIQTNKIKDLAGRVNWIHSISKAKYLKELEKRAARVDRVIRVLIQVNISGEDQKSGCEPEELAEILKYAAGSEVCERARAHGHGSAHGRSRRDPPAVPHASRAARPASRA